MKPTPQPAAFSGEFHVVIVDDEPDMLDLLGELIRTGVPEARVTLSESPFQALKDIAQDRVDLIVTDYRMPGLDGLELAKQIRRQHPRMPIVLMTAHADDRLRTDAFVARVNVFLKKPVDPAELLSEVRRLLNAAAAEPPRSSSDAGQR